MKDITVQYRFKLAHQPDEVFDINIDAQTLSMKDPLPDSLPDWTKLEFYQCPNCTLKPEQSPHCPLAGNLVNVVTRFNRLLSYDQLEVEVTSQKRIISNVTTAQRGLRSLMGLIIGVSDCPRTFFLKPMARFHLPFSDEIETIYRATSTYLLAQYFRKMESGKADFKLNGLAEKYHHLHLINTSIAHRLRNASQTDSTVNALVLLDIFTKALPKAIEESLEEIRYLFAPFLEESRKRKIFFKRKRHTK
jgi:hypothetical protein